MPVGLHLVGVFDQLGEFVRLARLRRREASLLIAVAAGEGGLVDPVPGEGGCENIKDCLVLLDEYVGVVGVPSTREGRVDTVGVGGGVDEEEGGVDGAALGGVAGLGIPEFEVLGDVVGGKTDGAGAAGEEDSSV